MIDHAEVRRLADVMSPKAIAKKLDCSAGYVRLIIRGEIEKGEGRLSRKVPKSLRGKSTVGMPAFDSPAIVGGRTIYAGTVASAADPERTVVKSAYNSAKIGNEVQKGKWRGFSIFTVTLEERATCPTYCKHWRSCVVPGTRVLTAALEWKPIETLAIGEHIFGFDEQPDPGTRRRSSRVSIVKQMGRTTKSCLKITTDKGEIVASDDHLWLARPGKRSAAIDPDFSYQWRRSDSLAIGDAIQYLTKPWDEDRSYEAGRIRGFVEGEGCLSTWGNGDFSRSEVSWAQLPGRLIEEINEIAEMKGFALSKRRAISGARNGEVTQTAIAGGWREALRFIGTFRPTRLIDKVEALIDGRTISGRGSEPARVLAIEPVGEQEVVEIETSTATLITEGFFSHNCFGNNMHQAERFIHGGALERRIAAEVAALGRKHPNGFAVRLHVLGDFYSVEYVDLWARLLDQVPALHVFGFSARWRYESDPIAKALIDLVLKRWDRFAIRFSNAPVDECSTVSIEHPLQAPSDAIVCPQQLGKTQACATCALCWQSKRRIAFIQH